ALVCCGNSVSAAPAQNSADRPTRLRVSDPALSSTLVAHGARVLADYGSYQLIETSDTSVSDGRPGVELEAEFDLIELNTGHLDTRGAEMKALRRPLAPFIGKRLHLVHFIGPIKPEWY